MSKDKKTYKERNGTTRVGDFLRSINFSKAADVVMDIVGGDFKGALETIKGSDELTPAQIEFALRELEYDMQEMQEVTKRWESDMLSDSFWSKNIRPICLGFLTVTLFIYIILDSCLEGFKIAKEWINLLSSLLLLVYGGYFGARSMEKISKHWKK